MSSWLHGLADTAVPALEAYTAVTAVVPILGTLIVTVVCAAMFVVMLGFGLTVQGQAIYSAAVFVVTMLVMLGGRRVGAALGRVRRTPLVMPLSAIGTFGASPNEVGHKAANLARFAETGGRVALGWVVTADAFDRFLKANELSPGPEETAEFADRIRAAKVPRRLMARLHRSVLASAEGAFLLRSSFADEDTADRAFPGVYESLPWNVDDGRAALEAALKEVWASYWSDRAIEYRSHGGADAVQRRRLAVLVNVKIPHDYWGFASSADVRTGFTERHLVEVAAEGSESTGMHDLLPNVVQVLAAHPGSEPSQELIREVSQLVGRAELLEGRPVEIEWGLRDGRVWIYQVRPLTSMPRRHTFTNSYVADVPRYALTPLSWWFLFGDEPPAHMVSRGLERLGFGSLGDRDAWVHRGVVYLRWSRFKPLFIGTPWRDLPFGVVLRVLGALIRTWLRGHDRVVSPPLPPAPPAGLGAAALLDRIEHFRRDRLIPLIRNQGIAVQAAAFTDALLRQILGAAGVPAARVTTPVEELRSALAKVDPSDPSATRRLLRSVWFLTEREAELSSLRAIDFPEAFLLRLGLRAGGLHGSGTESTSSSERKRHVAPIRWLVRLRDRLLVEREEINAWINALDYEARVTAEQLSALLAVSAPGWEQEDVFYFSLPELRQFSQGKGADLGTLLHLARHRRATHARNTSFDHPAVVHLDEHGGLVEEPALTLAENVITIGIPLGGGVARGPARVLHTGDWVRPESIAGSIVVLPDPSAVWTAAAGVAAGVLFARGGPLSHLAIWCRERGIPTVVAARRVYDLVKEGDRISIDGDRGEVRRD